jgi:hypothetical protein
MTEEESSKRLQQLLRLKRHESPPPGYFREFSGGVLDRIRAAEAERSVSGWRRWFFRSPPSSRGIRVAGDSALRDSDAGGWPARGWNASGFATVLTLIGGVYWAFQISAPEGDGNGGTDPGRQASLFRGALPGSTSESAPMMAGSLVGPGSSWTASDPAQSQSLRTGGAAVDSAFRFPVTVSMSGAVPEVSSTNPFPAGLFRLPGASGGGSEAYRVRFGEGPR